MDIINKFLGGNSKYQRLAGPLRAAQVCDSARSLADGRFAVLSFIDGCLTVGVTSSAASANLQFELPQIQKEINEKLNFEWVKKIRIKIVSSF
ncbi:MAG: DciA family protein [Candidatus Berkelbacteria bacterium]